MKPNLGLTVLLAATGLSGCAGSASPAPKVGDVAPPFTQLASDGASVGSADLLPGGPVAGEITKKQYQEMKRDLSL